MDRARHVILRRGRLLWAIPIRQNALNRPLHPIVRTVLSSLPPEETHQKKKRLKKYSPKQKKSPKKEKRSCCVRDGDSATPVPYQIRFSDFLFFWKKKILKIFYFRFDRANRPVMVTLPINDCEKVTKTLIKEKLEK